MDAEYAAAPGPGAGTFFDPITTTRPPLRRAPEIRVARAHQQQVRVEVDRHHLAPLVGAEVLDAARGREDARIQHQHVEPAEGARRQLERGGDRALVGDVAGEAEVVVALVQRLDRRD